eukprot:TRINITY_DN32231_c0_g1_i1.p2 TRINITY_DN32231_c0_g1~~TRINITY_DN32231_c0_g1_i1.p2  ORF type:complete len:481 (+),score=218.56 TRINITY_DN32231_c0_g1_i1:61-1443(+)
MTTQGAKDSAPYVGERVMLKGTGKWWSTGEMYRATIVDVRDGESVKVQYTADGGFKRFARSEFDSLRLESDTGDVEFGTLNVEWTDDVLSSMVGEVDDEVSRLRDSLKDAVVARDFIKADELKTQIQLHVKQADVRRNEQRLLLLAIKSEDFKEAARIQERINKLYSGESSKSHNEKELNFVEVMQKSLKRALGGGIAGAAAMVVQVTTLMWMRTTMNYQYRYGTSTTETLRLLWAEGGVPRFYRGIVPALAQGPLSRFGDTAANVGALAMLDHYSSTRDLPVAAKTIVASAAAASWRIWLTPLDTVKTMMQVEGKEGVAKLMAKARVGGPLVFYHGALGASAATFAGHYPWFATYNTLDAKIPVPQELPYRLMRNASLGFCASAVSDTVSNSLRVLKTYRQTATETVTYSEAARDIIKTDGMSGLFGRGLKTRILANGMQGMMFSVMWKYFDSVIKGTA